MIDPVTSSKEKIAAVNFMHKFDTVKPTSTFRNQRPSTLTSNDLHRMFDESNSNQVDQPYLENSYFSFDMRQNFENEIIQKINS